MTNHLHLLIKEVDEPIGMVMKRITSSYVYYFNHKYDRVGHLFQERFKSQPVEDDDYFVTLLRYIHQNPVKADMVSAAEEYRWSSFRELIDADMDSLCTRDRVWGMLTIAELKDIVGNVLDKNEEEGIMDYDSDAEDSEIMQMDDIRLMMVDLSGCRCAEEFMCLPKPVQRECIGRMAQEGAGIRDLSLLTGIPKSTVQRIATQWKDSHRAPMSVVADDSDLEDYPDY